MLLHIKVTQRYVILYSLKMILNSENKNKFESNTTLVFFAANMLQRNYTLLKCE